ncbi:MAG: DUF4012 domain-containing protein [Patescibacteria group bacterium]
MEAKKEKNFSIKITSGITSPSRHILDLKKNPSPARPAPKLQKQPSLAKELFIVDLAKFIINFFLFIPKNLKNFLKIFSSLRKFGGSGKNKENLGDAKPIYFDFSPPERWSRALGAFVAIAFIAVLPIKVFSSYEELSEQKNKILSKSFEAYEQLKKSDFSAASMSFASAKKTVDNLGFLINHIVSLVPGVGTELNMGNGLLIFGRSFSDAAAILQQAVNYFDKDVLATDKIRFLEKKVKEAIPHMLVASSIMQTLGNASGILPIDINPIKTALEESAKALLVFDDFSNTLLDLLGDSHFKRYLIVFQNNNEIRATGGFIGSFAVVDVDRGEIKQIDIPGGGSYDIKGQLKELVISPEPFHLINSAWQFQDSNWFPDFPEAAKKMMWFYEKSGGPSVDGVVAINATLMEELLDLIGPIDMPEYGRVMTADNFINETQKIVELEYDKTINKPKQVIADMTPKVLDKLLKIDAKNLGGLSKIAHSAILDKDILVYAKDEEIQEKLYSFGLTGKLRDIKNFTDYLMLVDTNIAGQKTDGKIVKEIKHESEIAEDGSIVNTVTITRKHTGVKGTIFSGVRNVNYLRLYVPLGSELISAKGFGAPSGNLFKDVKDGYSPDKDLERIQGPVYVDPKSGTRINNEFGRTVFGNWIMVDPGKEAVVTFKYKLPQKLAIGDASNKEKMELGFTNQFLTYSMLIEKQPGAKNTTFRSYVKLAGEKTVARVGKDVALQNDGWQYEADLNSDKYYGIVLEE